MGKMYTMFKLTETQQQAVENWLSEKKDAYEVIDAIDNEANYIYSSYDCMYVLDKHKKELRHEKRIREIRRSHALGQYDIFKDPFDDDKDKKRLIGVLIKYIYSDGMMLKVLRYVVIRLINHKEKTGSSSLETVLDVIDCVTDPYDGTDKYNRLCQRLFINQVNRTYAEALEAFKNENKYSGIEIVEDHYNKMYKNIDNNAYAYEYIMIYAALYKKYPFVEQLLKAGYENLIYGWLKKIEQGKRDNKFKVLLKPGKNIKSIIQLPKYIYEDLKEEEDINVWDNIRLLNKKYSFTNESYQKLRSFNIPIGLTSSLQGILKMEFDGKPLYDINTLMAYLARVDMYQAISPDEAIQILYDYLYMNLEMKVKPDTNSNSLKREHDVTTRNYDLVAREIEDEKFREIVKKFKKYEYNNGKYCIIAPTCGHDLINEGRNNRNCVGSYINHIINKRDMIFFMRRAESPDKSMITIEVSPNGKEIWQKYETANRSITDKEKLDFIDEWMKFINEKR